MSDTNSLNANNDSFNYQVARDGQIISRVEHTNTIEENEIISRNIFTGWIFDICNLSQHTTPSFLREYLYYYGTMNNPCVEVSLGPRQMKLLIGDNVSIIDIPESQGGYFIEMENQKDIKECFFCGGELSKQGCWNVCCQCDRMK